MLLDIKESTSLKRDMANSAVINTDELAYRQYLELYDKKIKESKSTAERINKIEQDVDFIKSALSELLSRVST